MNPQTLDTAMNLILPIVLLGAAAFMVYRWTRPKKMEKEVPKRPESYRPRARQEESEDDEELMSRNPIADFREMPTRSPMREAIAKPPSFRTAPSIREEDLKTASGGFKTAIAKPKSYKTASKPKASSGTHSPYRSNDDVTIPIAVASSSDSPRCDTPTHSGDSSSSSDSGGSCGSVD